MKISAWPVSSGVRRPRPSLADRLPPNPRLQRTRAARSPLSRKPFGGARESHMKNSILKCLWLAALCWPVASVARAGEPSAWPELSPPQAGFSIRMPGTPTERLDPETGVQNFQLLQGDQSYVASVAYLPRELREMTPQQLLDRTRAGFLRLLPNSRLITSEPVKVGGFPGITCVIQSQAPGRAEFKLKMSAVVANGRLFSFGFISRQDAFSEAEVDKYLATFRLK